MKALWAFEPRGQSQKSIKGMSRLLENLVKKPRDLSIGYVVTESEIYLYTAYDVPIADRFTSYPKELIMKELKKAGVTVEPGQVDIFNHRTISTTPAVDHLLNQARKKKVDLIALHTHNKKGIERLVMGSFAETTVHRSRADLLLAGPNSTFPSRLRNIFFASDFSPKSKRDLGEVLALCKRIGARLTVFHAANPSYRWAIDEADRKVQAYRRATDDMAQWIQNEGRKAGVPCSVEINADFDSIPNLTLKAAKKAKADLIILRAKVGPAAALIGGSVTRNILRNSKSPVLVLKR